MDSSSPVPRIQSQEFMTTVNSNSKLEKMICDYCLQYHRVLGIDSGPCSLTIRFDDQRRMPVLMKLKTTWSDNYFMPIMRSCLGYDSITATLDSFFHSSEKTSSFSLLLTLFCVFSIERYSLIPVYPRSASSIHGKIVHLFSFQRGRVEQIPHLSTLHSLPSVKSFYFPLQPGDIVSSTLSQQPHQSRKIGSYGFVILINTDRERLEADEKTITALQRNMFVVSSGFSGENMTNIDGGSDGFLPLTTTGATFLPQRTFMGFRALNAIQFIVKEMVKSLFCMYIVAHLFGLVVFPFIGSFFQLRKK
jgi:hypothetical protein